MITKRILKEKHVFVFTSGSQFLPGGCYPRGKNASDSQSFSTGKIKRKFLKIFILDSSTTDIFDSYISIFPRWNYINTSLGSGNRSTCGHFWGELVDEASRISLSVHLYMLQENAVFQNPSFGFKKISAYSISLVDNVEGFSGSGHHFLQFRSILFSWNYGWIQVGTNLREHSQLWDLWEHICGKWYIKKWIPDLQYMLHSLVQGLCASCSWGCCEAQDLWQWFFSLQLFLHIESHYFVVDFLLLSVVALINYQQSNICRKSSSQFISA